MQESWGMLSWGQVMQPPCFWIPWVLHNSIMVHWSDSSIKWLSCLGGSRSEAPVLGHRMEEELLCNFWWNSSSLGELKKENSWLQGMSVASVLWAVRSCWNDQLLLMQSPRLERDRSYLRYWQRQSSVPTAGFRHDGVLELQWGCDIQATLRKAGSLCVGRGELETGVRRLESTGCL